MTSVGYNDEHHVKHRVNHRAPSLNVNVVHAAKSLNLIWLVEDIAIRISSRHRFVETNKYAHRVYMQATN